MRRGRSKAHFCAATLVACCVLPLAAYQKELPAAAAAIADEIAGATQQSVAVVDFTDLQGNVTELGRYIAEEISLGLVIAKKGLSVIDRTHLTTILREHKLASTGLIDPATARKLGEIAGVGVLVTGSITPLGDNVRLVVKVLDTKTARILVASSVDMAKTKTIEELMARDLRGSERSSESHSGPAVPPVRSPDPSELAAFSPDALKITSGGAGCNYANAGVSLVIENTSRQPLYLAIHAQRGQPAIMLSDNRGNQWRLINASGIAVIEDSRNAPQNDFTLIAPGGQVTLVMNFASSGRASTPSTFSVAMQALRYSSGGPVRLSLGLADISVGSRFR